MEILWGFHRTLKGWDSCFGCKDILILPSPLFCSKLLQIKYFTKSGHDKAKISLRPMPAISNWKTS